ncbi:nicotinate-nucleotide--dimethylbenzimidazole phosphoribosyltransferase [Streptomyces sp. NPDC094049]|uniref:nicotinate-nucleotide--dimethylbenzimidazole phosphoribosyltransferase n=1 Tax=Streptomyces sp. NPDC094049 TaxID=3154987 RepID=UPI00332D83B6
MTDTGQVPGEGLPENAGMVEQPGIPAPGAYAFLDPSEHPAEDDDVLLMPGAQGAWSEHPPGVVPAPPVAVPPPSLPNRTAPHQGLPDPAAQEARVPSGAPLIDPLTAPLDAVALGDVLTAPQQQTPPQGVPVAPAVGTPAHGIPAEQFGTPAHGVPAQQFAGTPAHGVPVAPQEQTVTDHGYEPGILDTGAHGTAGHDTGSVDLGGVPVPPPAPAAARRPLHMGPPVPESGGVVLSLADRGPAAPPAPQPVPAAAPEQMQPTGPAPVRSPGPPTSGPEYLDVPQDQQLAPQGAEPWTAQPQVPAAHPFPVEAETVVPAPGFVQVEGTVPTAPHLAPHPAPAAGQAPAEAPAPAVDPVVEAAPETLVAPEALVAAEAPAAAAQEAPAEPVVAPPAEPAEAVAPEILVPAPREGEPAAEAVEAAAPEPEQTQETAPEPEPAAEAAGAPAPAPESPVESPSPATEQAEAPVVPEPLPAEPPVEAVAEDLPPVQEAAPADVPPQPVAEPAPAAEATAVPTEDRGSDGTPEVQEAVGSPEPVESPESPEAVEVSEDAVSPETPGSEEVPATGETPEAEAAPATEAAIEGEAAPATEAAPEAEEIAETPESPEAPEAVVAEPAEATEATEATANPEATENPEVAPDAVTDTGTGPLEESAPAPGYDDAEREAVLRVMRERRDIRNGFRSDPIPHEVLLRVLEAAHTAPSVGHSQPWDFVVIRSAETRQTMHELAVRQREAYAESLPKARAKQFKELKIEAILDTPVNIVVTADPTRGGRHTLGRYTQPQMAPYSSALAVENLWLAARAEGLGVGWVSFFDEREMVRALGLPEHLEVVAYLCVGYVDEFPEEPELMQAGWSKRRPLAWVVHEETYGRRALPGEEPHDLLQETVADIRPLDAKALGEAWERQKRMTKPAGALGMLEIISAQLSGLSRVCPPPIPEPAAVAIFAGDHGVHAQGVTPWPQEVTGQMVANFLGGGAVCNAFAHQVGAEVCVIDVGVASELPATPGLLPRKVRPGTADFTIGTAMTREEVLAAIEVGIETARDLVAAGNKALLTGEMGIANTTASAALISVYTGVDPAEVTGRGTGINDDTHARKVDVVRRALDLHKPDPEDPIGVLAAVGGLEHAALVGLILGGASLRTPVILDGVSTGAAALVARAVAPESLAACIAGHRSAEPGHVAALNKLGLRPLVDLDLRLGEGTGALLALPLVQSAARAMHEVATFDSAGVTEK